MTISPCTTSLRLLALAAICTAPSTTYGQRLFWAEGHEITGEMGQIRHSNLNGGDLVILPLVPGPTHGIAVDPVHGKLYWTVLEPQGVIKRANLDGSNVETLISGLAEPWGIALDVAAGKMYFTLHDPDLICRANLDGTAMETLFEDTQSPTSIALDLANGKMYWGRLNSQIRRANLDGSEVEALGPPDSAKGLTLDLAAGKIYYTSNDTTLRRCNLNGTDPQTLIAGLDWVLGLALDVDAGKMYFAETGPHGMKRANLDGTQIELFVPPGPVPVSAIAVLKCPPVSGPMPDCNGNAIPDTCEDCNGNQWADSCDVADGTSADCTGNGVPDECEEDCNGNGQGDSCDVSSGASEDCTGNGLPDECEPDCNGNGEPDSCDVLNGLEPDCNSNERPDDCDVVEGFSPDCNTNGLPDECDVAAGASPDCQPNGIPDECEADCNDNGTADDCETDCNGNGSPDDCDVANGTSLDEDGNGIPDECFVCDQHRDCSDVNNNNVRDNKCVWSECDFEEQLCHHVPLTIFADMGSPFGVCPPDGFANLGDRVHALRCFAGTNPCNRFNADAGGAFGSCNPDGFCNLFDATHALTTFAHTNACSCPGQGPAPEEAGAHQVAGAVVIDLEAKARRVGRGQVIDVDVYARPATGEAVALWGYQLEATVSGGAAGMLELIDIRVEPRRSAAIAPAEQDMFATNILESKMLSALGLESLAMVEKRAYLATLTYRATPGASGTFVVDILHDQKRGHQTFLLGGPTVEVQVDRVEPAVIQAGG